MKRYLYAWFPDWPLDRLRRTRWRNVLSSAPAEPRPFTLIEQGPHGLVVAAVNADGARLNIWPGLAFTDARARAPNLAFEEIDRAADRAALHKLADWMVRYSPRAALDGDDALILETGGCEHLFGGERGMAEEIARRFAANGYAARLAMAGTPAAACALARFAATGNEPFILPDGEEREGVSGLPVSALRLSHETVRVLRRFGLTRIGQLYGVDRKALARRFASREAAEAVVLRLDQVLGLRHEPIRPLVPPPDWCVRLACPEPVAASAGVDHALETLARELCIQLDTHGVGARDFRLYAFRADGGCSHIAVSAARPVRDAVHIRRLFAERIDRIDPGFGIDLFLLTAGRAEAMDLDAAPLSAEMAGKAPDLAVLARLADRLAARLGDDAVLVAQAEESHVPERAERWRIFDGALPESAGRTPAMGPRPLRLFERPERVDVLAEIPDGLPARFVWRRVTRHVARAEGPERIAPEWWKLSEKGVRARDYYRVEDEKGRRYWIYRDGLYDDNRGGPPQWYVHGLFA